MVTETTQEPELETPTGNVETETPKKTGAVSYYKEQLAQIQQEKENLAAELEAARTSQLQEKENFKELWELEKKKRTEAEEKSTRISESYFDGLKSSAIESFAVKHGIKNEALADLGLLNKDMVQIETTSTGNANVIGALEFVETIKESRPHWFNAAGAPRVNGANPEMAKPKTYSANDLIKMQKENPELYRSEMMKRING